MSSVLAQFHLVEAKRIMYHPSGEATNFKFVPVQGEPFGPATPNGTLELLIVNPAAAKVFHDAQLGQKFNVEIKAVDE